MVSPRSARALMAVAALGAAVQAAAAQQSVPVVRLDTQPTTFTEPFSEIHGLRELSDGRVLISDALEQSLVVADFTRGTERTIGRQGGGPGEYTAPGPLFALDGDTTLMVDIGSARGALITPEAAIGLTVSLPYRGLPLLVRGADRHGRLYAEVPFAIVNGNISSSTDSVPVVRWDPRNPAVQDTVARVAESSNTFTIRLNSGSSPSYNGQLRPFSPSDAWAAARDGRVALVHATNNHVEWIGTNGTRIEGPAVPYTPVPVTRADKNAWADRQAQMRMVIRRPDGARTIHPPRPDPDKITWPDEKPAFMPGRVFVTPEGELWVERYEPSHAPEAFDVFDATAARVKQVVLPKDRELVGFGRGTVYLMRRDADDLEWLERYER